jgi:nucleoside-diphosphate-sugar epimerase
MTYPSNQSNRDDAGPRRVLVAGAGGFIGGHLVRELLDRGHTVRGADNKPVAEWHQVHDACENVVADLSELGPCRDACAGIDWVFNLAADMGGIGFIENFKADCMLSVLINTHLLVASRDTGVERFFFSSSACVYRADRQVSPDSTALIEADAYPAMPEDGYGWEKLFSERMCRHFQEDFGLQTRVARYHNVYGPWGTYEGGREKAPAALCRKVAEAVNSGVDAIEIWGDGEQTRSFMYIDDCVDGTLRLFESDHSEPINLGSSELITINHLAEMVERIAGVNLGRNHDLSAPQGVRGRNSDNQLISDVLGWEPNIPLETGMAETYAWIRDQIAASAGIEASAELS